MQAYVADSDLFLQDLDLNMTFSNVQIWIWILGNFGYGSR